MYCDFYQLTERPFNVTPDPKFLYLNARYREALASLNYGISQRKGFITLIGEAGTGKTTLLKRLLEDLDPKTKTVFIFNTNVSFEEILEYILAEFDLPVHNGKKLYMLQRLNTFLLEELRGAGNVALLIDEAQDLEFTVLEDLRLLSNLETAKEKILQIVLSGQPELGQKLSNPVLRQLRQRIGINCRLLPLSRDEITEYIEYRLQAAQCPDLKLFTREAEDQVYHFSRGIPRLVNVVCDNALVIGYALGKKRISEEIIREAAADLLSLETRVEEPKETAPSVATPAMRSALKVPRRNARLGVIAAFVAALVVGLLSVGRTMLTRPAALPPSERLSTSSYEVIRPGSHPRGAGTDPPADPPAAGSDRVAAAAEPGAPVVAAEPRIVASAPLARDVPPSRPEEMVPRGSEPGSAVEPPRPVEAPAPVARAQAPVPREAADQREALDPDAQAPGAVAKIPMPDRQARPKASASEPKAPSGVNANALGVKEPPREGADVAPRQARPAEAAARSAAAESRPARPAVRENREDVAASAANDAPPALNVVSPKKSEAVRVAATRPAAVEDDGQNETVPAIDDDASIKLSSDSSPDVDGVAFASQVVRVGDSVSGIAMRKYGQASYTVLDLLKLANPEVTDIDAISVGQTIRLPELGEGYPILNEPSGKYSLLVVSSPQQRKAKQLQAALRARGFDARVTNTSVGDGKPLYRVVVGGYGGRDKVAAAGKQVQRLFREDSGLARLAD